jgi:phage tail sheath gpL-like
VTISTTVSTDLVAPGTFNVFNYLKAANALVNVPLSVALIATKSSAGTGVVGQIYDVNDANVIDGIAGPRSEGAIMARAAIAATRALGKGPKIVLTLLAEPGGGTANVQTITMVGTASADGVQIFKISGRVFPVTIRAGDVQNTIASNVAAAFNAVAETLPVTITVATNVVTATHPTKGVNGGDVVISCEQQVSGCVATVATTAAGAGVVDISPALLTLSPNRYDGIAIANHASADITAFLADEVVRWAPESKTWGWYFMFSAASIGTATALAAAANERTTLIGSMEGSLSAPGENAAVMAVLAFSRERPNSSYDGAVVPMYPPAQGVWYTAPERNTAIKAGLTPFVGVIDSSGAVVEARAKCVQMVTTKTTVGGLPDDRNRDLAVSRTGVAIALQLDAAVADLHENNPDGIPQSQAKKLYRDIAVAILRAESRSNPPVLNPEFVEDDIQAIEFAVDGSVVGRLNSRIPYHPDIPNHQVAWYHDVIVGA